MRILTSALILGLCSATWAAADKFDASVASIQLLQDRRVQTELKVTEAQRKKLNAHAQSFNKQAEAYRQELLKKSNNGKTQVKPDPQREVQMLTNLKAKVLGELSATQIKRLREISLQAVGVTALGDPVVAQKVGLDSGQVTKIQNLIKSGLAKANKILEDATKRAEQAMKPAKTQAEVIQWQKDFQAKAVAEQKKVEPQVQKVRSETIANVLALLNSKQKNTWKTLQGTPFNG